MTVATGVLSTANNGQHVIDPIQQVARAPSGNFVLLWDTSRLDSLGVAHYSTYVQLYNPTGTALTRAVQVGKGSNLAESVAMNNNGFDVLEGAIASSSDSSTGSVTLTVQRYDSSGSTIGKPISVATPSYGWLNGGPDSIGMDSNSNFVVAWNDFTGAWANPGNYFYIYAQRYNSSGKAQGSVIQVNPTVPEFPNIADDSSLSMDQTTGDFVVAWEQDVPYPTDPSAVDVSNLYARQFSATGTPVQANSDITVTTGTYGTYVGTNGTTYSYPTGGMLVGDSIGVAALPGGGGAFDISWTNFYQTITPDSSYSGGYKLTNHTDIYAASYGSSGTLSQSLQVSSPGTGSAAAVDANNDLVVLWGALDGQFYLDPPAPSATTTSPAATSPTGASSPSGSTTAATDAVFAAYAYPDDDDTLG